MRKEGPTMLALRFAEVPLILLIIGSVNFSSTFASASDLPQFQWTVSPFFIAMFSIGEQETYRP
jgi:hypothetical protein